MGGDEPDICEALFESRHVLIAVLDRDFRFVRVNQAYSESVSRSAESLIGLGHFDLYPHAENESIFRGVLETLPPDDPRIHGTVDARPRRPKELLVHTPRLSISSSRPLSKRVRDFGGVRWMVWDMVVTSWMSMDGPMVPPNAILLDVHWCLDEDLIAHVRPNTSSSAHALELGC